MKAVKIGVLILLFTFLCYQCIRKAPSILYMYACVDAGNEWNWETLECEPGPAARKYMVEYQQESAILCELIFYYKEDYGAFPSELNDVKKLFNHDSIDWSGMMRENIEQEIRDPYSGSNYVYKKLNKDQFILYSVGPDGKDDGGIPLDSAKNTGDIIICPEWLDL